MYRVGKKDIKTKTGEGDIGPEGGGGGFSRGREKRENQGLSNVLNIFLRESKKIKA